MASSHAVSFFGTTFVNYTYEFTDNEVISMNQVHQISVLFMVLLVLSSSPIIHAAPILASIKTEPNRAIFYGIGTVQNPSVTMNSDKTQIIVAVEGAGISDKARAAFGKGMIHDIDVVQDKGLAKIYVQLKEKQGFTLSRLPYSDALVLDVFSWDNLSAHDDMYRSGLLALTDGLTQQAIQLLRGAADKGNADAAAYVGIELIKQGLYDEALGWLKKAIRSSTKIADAYAGLCQIARVNGMTEEAQTYEKRFCEMSGMRSVLDISVEYQPPQTQISDNQLTEEPASIATMMQDELILSDSVSAASAKQDTSRFASLFGQDSTKSAQINSTSSDLMNASLMPQWMKTVSIAAIGVLASAVIAMVIMYIRWRQRRKDALDEGDDDDEGIIAQPSTAFALELQQAQTQKPHSVAQTALQTYTKSFDKTIDDASSEPLRSENSQPLEKNTVQEKTMLEEFIGEVINRGKYAVDKGKNYMEERKQSLVEGVFSPEEDEDILWQDDAIITPQRGEYELAMNLQAKQRLQRSQSLGNLDAALLPSQKFGVTKVARKLGVETGSIEAKRSMAHLQTDAHALSDLRKKFSKTSSVHFAQ